MRPPPDSYGETMAALGYALRLEHRRIARECGLATMPGFEIIVNGVPCVVPDEDLTKLLPEEMAK